MGWLLQLAKQRACLEAGPPHWGEQQGCRGCWSVLSRGRCGGRSHRCSVSRQEAQGACTPVGLSGTEAARSAPTPSLCAKASPADHIPQADVRASRAGADMAHPPSACVLVCACLLADHALGSCSEGIAITDPSQAGHPLVYVNDAFLHITGWVSAHGCVRPCAPPHRVYTCKYVCVCMCICVYVCVHEREGGGREGKV